MEPKNRLDRERLLREIARLSKADIDLKVRESIYSNDPYVLCAMHYLSVKMQSESRYQSQTEYYEVFKRLMKKNPAYNEDIEFEASHIARELK